MKMSKEDILKEIAEIQKNTKGEVLIEIVNLKTNGMGVANLLTNKNQVAVYEGNDNGSDDKIYTIEDFIKNYHIVQLNIEFEQIEEEFE